MIEILEFGIDFTVPVTGINYTYLYSEFSTSLYPNIHSEQKLHYLGVPVGLSWQFWKTNGFSISLRLCYASEVSQRKALAVVF